MINIFGIFLRNIGIDIISYTLRNTKLIKIYNIGIRKKYIINIDSTTIINRNFALTK